ncbi:hypothetical protein ACFTAO_08670 [Paenibacillus rhizoplanae]
MLIVDQYNRLTNAAVDALGLDYEAKSINLSDLVGTQLKLINNNDYYKKRMANSLWSMQPEGI